MSLLLADERIVRDGLRSAAGTVRTVAIVWGCFAVLYGAVRYLKKGRRLESTSLTLSTDGTDVGLP